MKTTPDDGANKDTFWNLAVLIGAVLLAIASVVDLPQTPPYVTHVAYGQATGAR